MSQDKKNKIILFQGDSVSDGNRYKDPMARGDLNHQIGHTFIYTIASELGYKYADKNLAFVNRAISGENIETIYDRREEDIFEEHPDVFSILVGSNEYWIWKDEPDHTEEFDEMYRQLLDEVLEHNPDTKIVISEPMVLPVVLEPDVYNARLKMTYEEIEVLQKIAEDYGAIYIPLLEKFQKACEIREASYWMWDGVHPTEAGHGMIANEWMKAVLPSGILGFKAEL